MLWALSPTIFPFSQTCLHVRPLASSTVVEFYMPDGVSRNNEGESPCAVRYLEVAIAELDCEPLLASVRHCLAVSVDGHGCLSPASAIEPFLLKDIELSGRNPTFTSTTTGVRRYIGNNAPGPVH